MVCIISRLCLWSIFVTVAALRVLCIGIMAMLLPSLGFCSGIGPDVHGGR